MFDSEGNAWTGANFIVGSQASDALWDGNMAKFAPNGRALSPAPTGFSGGGLEGPGFGTAVDANDRVWITSTAGITMPSRAARRAQRLLHRHESAAHRHDPAATARQPDLSAARHAGARQVPARSRLQHRRVRQEPSRRPYRRPADGARLPGVLGLPLPPRRDAGGELPRHQQDPDPADGRAALQEHADPRRARGARCGGSQDHDLPDAAAPGPLVQVATAPQRTRCARTRVR